MSFNRSKDIKKAATLPVGHPYRRQLLAALAPDTPLAKVAFKKETEAFVTWALQKNEPISPSQVQRFIERVTGREPIEPASAPKPRRGPLEEGETVIVDKYRNTNPLNADVAEEFHDQVGTVVRKSPEGLTVQFENGKTAFFEGQKAGKATGLYRWTPKAQYQERAVGKKALIELVYLRGGTRPPPQRDIDALEAYVERGLARGENRSDTTTRVTWASLPTTRLVKSTSPCPVNNGIVPQPSTPQRARSSTLVGWVDDPPDGLKMPGRWESTCDAVADSYTKASRVADRWMEKSASHHREARNLRIYEYVDNKGVVLWSFTRLPFHAVRRLNVTDVRGTHFRTHISDIQRMANQMQLLDEDE